ncbi:MAG: phosphoribosylformylglycinamidine synthase I [Candidatus Veblenbacteria bacterium]|nr:phosphoribosylformylglycinamidine synthase I [Candidatus Veblenbacteria bacterium]
MYKIAIIQFPGTNCEYEAYRAIKQAGMVPEFFRWNQPTAELAEFAGYFIPGGFSYEDRIRSGAIAARDPLMRALRQEADAGKPIIGICNGAQILVEAGFIPGLNGYALGASLAANERGYLNFWVHIKNEAAPGRCAFNNFKKGHVIRLPIAHGEGRYVIPQPLLDELIKNDQVPFRYCTADGEVKNEYPVNPNGAVYNIAGVCNPAGNVLALMPHPERTLQGAVAFASLKDFLEHGKAKPATSVLSYQPAPAVPGVYEQPKGTLEFLVDLIITDNEAETLQGALQRAGFKDVRVRRFTHWEVGLAPATAEPAVAQEIVAAGELFNSNKEQAYLNDRGVLTSQTYRLLVRDRDDFVGPGKCSILQHRFGLTSVAYVKRGVVWQVEAGEAAWQSILADNILYNPYAQEALTIS